MMPKRFPRRWLSQCLRAACTGAAIAPWVTSAGVTLSAAPPQVFIHQPAPNVFITLDDSSSMAPTAKWSALKAAITSAFSPDAISDGQIRLAWQSLHSCTQFGDTQACGGDNRLKVLDSAHRQAFLNFLDTRTPSSFLAGTPTQRAARRVAESLRAHIDVNSPWAAVPTAQLGTALSCRKAYHVIMTDGAWTNHPYFLPAQPLGNADGTAGTLPDGTSYSNALPTTRIYRDSAANTLADEAFDAWSRDLQASLNNDVPAITAIPNDQTYGHTSLPPYWNPRNDPATWQHLNTYTISFQADPDSTWAIAPQFNGESYGGDLLRIADGALTWPAPKPYGQDEDAQKVDMWHAAINGRGQFIAATSNAALTEAFRTILANIERLSNTTLTTAITVANQLVRTSTQFYLSAFKAQGWSGELNAWSYAPGGSSIALWSAHQRLDLMAAADRVIYTFNASTPGLFKWSQLSTDWQTALGSERVLNYLRGERSNELQKGGNLRDRNSRLGDIIHSAPWHMPSPQRRAVEYAGHASFRDQQKDRPGMVWVGANDGMLHGFNSQSGDEMVAIVPLGVRQQLTALSQVDYAHQYAVDGPVFSGDANLASDENPDWHTFVVAGLGLGGKGYMVLDATNAHFENTTTSAQQTLLLDTSDGSDPDIGNITTMAAPMADDTQQSPQIVRLNDGRWALITGNGANSSKARAVLVVQYLDGAHERIKLTTPYTAQANVGESNGLGAPRALDLNADGRVDFIYAGDMHGQLWRFDLQSTAPALWHAPSKPLFLAQVSAGETTRAQAIWAAPVVAQQVNHGVQVVFATGQRLSNADEADATQQSIYSLHDNLVTTAAWPYQRGDLQGQTVTAPTGILGPSSSSLLGWLLDLPEQHERVVQALVLTQDKQVLIDSVVPGQSPQGESCGNEAWASDTHYLTILHSVQHINRFVSGQTNRYQLGTAAAALATTSQSYVLTAQNQVPSLQTINTPIHPDLSRARRISWREVLP